MEILIVAIVAVLLLVAFYLFLICPRIWGKPSRTHLHGVHYAHRGLFDNKTEAPENSIRAIRKAIHYGYGIEFDVQLSKDDIPVVFHDASLKRMCGVDGKVWEYTLEELQKMKLATSNETIPTLQEVLKVVGGQVPLIIEYKMDRPDTKVCELANKLLDRYEGSYCIESFHPFAVRWYKKHRPDVVRGQLSQNFAGDKKYGGVLGFVLTNLLLNFLGRPDFVAYCHSDAKNISRRLCTILGALPVAWTIRSQQQYEAAKPHFQLFIFDSCIPKG